MTSQKKLLKLLQRNAELNQVTVDFQEINILTAGFLMKITNGTSLWSNPPYIAQQEMESMHQNVVDYEPAFGIVRQ